MVPIPVDIGPMLSRLLCLADSLSGSRKNNIE
jgi:hypothetical protein